VQVLFLQGQSTCFGRKRPSSGVFKTGTAATGTCVIVSGQSSHLLIRASCTVLHQVGVSFDSLLHMLLVWIRCYLKSVLRYKCLILDVYIRKHLREQGCDDPRLFFETKSSPGAKFCETLYFKII